MFIVQTVIINLGPIPHLPTKVKMYIKNNGFAEVRKRNRGITIKIIIIITTSPKTKFVCLVCLFVCLFVFCLSVCLCTWLLKKL